MQILRDLLSSAGYEIIEAENGELALAAVAQRRPDLILMDIQIPIIDGYEVTRRIKADPALKSIPVIAVTSHAIGDGEEKARALVVAAVRAKPRLRCGSRKARSSHWLSIHLSKMDGRLCPGVATFVNTPWCRNRVDGKPVPRRALEGSHQNHFGPSVANVR